LDALVTDQGKRDNFSNIVNHDPVLLSLASFLDPLSLTRCVHVSKYWAAIEQFKCDHIWSNLCKKRFGDDKLNFWVNSISKSLRPGKTVRNIDLYERMHEANIQPRCPVQGNVSVGEGKVKGVSAWASMTERSNGETLRSVRTFPSNDSANRKQTSEKDPFGKHSEYTPLPVVELRIVIQNTGNQESVVVPDQTISVDAGTRRKGEEMKEINSDDRFSKSILNLDGYQLDDSHIKKSGECVHLKLFDSVVLVVHIHARGCSTISKFCTKSNFTKILVSVNGLTVPLLIPFTAIGKGSIFMNESEVK